MFRAIIYSNIRNIIILYPNNSGLWFSCNGYSYIKDRDAIAQVMNKDGKIKNLVESIYIEGNPLPLHSKLNLQEITNSNLETQIAYEGNRPKPEGFWGALTG